MAERIVHELHKPEDADAAQSAIEIVRAWVIDEHLQCALSVDVFKDRAQWGVFLADLANHIASGMNKVHGADPAETLDAILKVFRTQFAEHAAMK